MTRVRLIDGRVEVQGDEGEALARLEFDIPTDPGEQVVDVKLSHIGRSKDGDPLVVHWTAIVVGEAE